MPLFIFGKPVMTMVVNKIVVCPICEKKTFLRIQCGGYINSYPIRLNCINCRALLKGQFVMKGSGRGLTMFNADVLECNIDNPAQQWAKPGCINVRNADYVAEISGELPCKHVSVYKSDIPLSPFMRIADRIGSTEGRIARLQNFEHDLIEWKRTKSTTFQLLDEGSLDYIPIALNNKMGNYSYQCDHYLKALHCLQEIVLEETKYLFPTPGQDDCVLQLIDFLSVVDKNLLHVFCEDTGGTTELLFLYRKAISVFSSFMDIYANVLPAETYMYLKNNENMVTAISTCSFSDIKTFYQDAYETLGNLLFVPVCLDNIVLRNNHNFFEKAYKSVRCYSSARDLSWYRELNNGIRINLYNNNEVFQHFIDFPANRLLRNGIGHNNVKYDGVTQTITAYDQKEPEKVTVEMSLMDMAIDCIGMAKTAVILSEMILFLLREEFRRENITTIIHPRFYMNREPNDKCPCGSYKKFKKCCKNEVDGLS